MNTTTTKKEIPRFLITGSGSHYTFKNGRRLDIDSIATYGIDELGPPSHHHVEIGSFDVYDDIEGAWRDATEEELEEINADEEFIYDLVYYSDYFLRD